MLNFQPSTSLDLDAFASEFAEEQSLKDEMAVINAAWQEYAAEQAKPQPKYVRVARKYVPELKKIFWQGALKSDAQEILSVLMLEQTMPLETLTVQHGMDGEEYVEVDSYTGEPLQDLDLKPRGQWDKDYIEIQREIQFMDEEDVGFLDEPDYDLYRKMLSHERDGEPYVPPTVVVTPATESLEARIVAECATLGYTPEQTAQALEASAFNVFGDERDWYDDRSYLPVPIQVAVEGEFHPNDGSLLVVRNEWRKYWQRSRENKEHGKYPDILLTWLRWHAHRYPPEAIYLFALVEEVDEGHWSKIMLKTCTLESFAETFGDNILDEIFDPGDPISTTSDEEIIAIAEMWEKEIIEMQFSNAADARIEHTQAYARGVFGAIATGENDLRAAGYRNWRWENSKAGTLAYDWVMANTEGEWKDRLKKAMRAFWNAGKIISIKLDGVLVKSEANEQEQFCNWGLAKWKLARNEIYLANEDRERLKNILIQKGWGNTLMGLL